jgi:CBS domain-containing protein
VRSFEHSTVQDVMNPGVVSCTPDTLIAAVARILATHRIHAVVVEGVRRDPLAGEQLVWGVVSDLDLLRAARAGADNLTAAEVAAAPITGAPSLPLTEAARLMIEHATTHLIVVDRDRPVGVVSSLDVAGVLAWGRG